MLLKTRPTTLLKRRRMSADDYNRGGGGAADNFHRAIGPVIFTAQLFGVFPVAGIFAAHPRGVRFRWRQWRNIPTALVIAGAAGEMLLSIVYHLSHDGLDYGKAQGLIFVGTNLFIVTLFAVLATEWPRLIRQWHRCEAVFLLPPYLKSGRRSMSRRIRVVCFTVLLIALAEHILFFGSEAYNAHEAIRRCNHSSSFVEYWLKHERAHIHWMAPRSDWVFVPLETLNIAMTFAWTFIDVWIMAVSLGLAWRFRQIGERLEAATGRVMPDSFWIEMRSHYLVMVELLQLVDARISGFVLMSTANNLFFVCKQLFNSFAYIPNAVNAVYFWVSLFCIIARTLAMLFCAAAIHDASRRPVAVLRNVPASSWGLETQRFSTQIATGDVVALSGKRFFYLTRSVILAMAGTVATYELVLLDELKDIEQPVLTCK